MKFAHIAPTDWIPIATKFSSIHLSLAHLVEQDETYVKNFLQAQQREYNTMILDNSAFEMYKQGKQMFPSHKLLELGNKIGADYVVMSDYPNEPWEKTIDAAIEFAPKLRDAGFGTFFVPQSQIGKVEDLIKSFDWAVRSSLIDYIGVSILAIPNAYGVEKNNKLQRFLSRWHFMNLLKDHGILSIARLNYKKIHFLGMVDGPNEIDLVKPYIQDGTITSWDSSSAVWHGINRIKYDRSPTGLINGKLEKEVDFNTKRDTIINTDVMYNINTINLKVGNG